VKITCIVGARPQFIKLSPFLKAAEAAKHKVRIIHTGQHYDDEMSDSFFRDLEMKAPDLNLNVGSNSQAIQTAQMLEGVEVDLLQNKPDWVVVFGDTNSTLAGSLAAAKINIPTAHIEAGLRSFNRQMPEEINRIVTDHLCDLLFVPSDEGMINLKKEGLTEKSIRTGDLMADVLETFRNKLKDNILNKFEVEKGEYCLLTLHRPASVDNHDMLCWMIDQVSRTDKTILFPAHPRTRKAIEHGNIEIPNSIKLIPPLGYLEFQTLQAKALAILTDSGGVQKEAYLWKVPCFTLRTETEWTETIDSGWNTIVFPGKGDLKMALDNWKAPKAHPNLYGDGHASEAIVRELYQKK